MHIESQVSLLLVTAFFASEIIFCQINDSFDHFHYYQINDSYSTISIIIVSHMILYKHQELN